VFGLSKELEHIDDVDKKGASETELMMNIIAFLEIDIL